MGVVLLLLVGGVVAQQHKQYSLCAINEYKSGDCLPSEEYKHLMPFCGDQISAAYVCLPQLENTVWP